MKISKLSKDREIFKILATSSLLGILVFLAISSTLPFGKGLFSMVFNKPNSNAQTLGRPDVIPPLPPRIQEYLETHSPTPVAKSMVKVQSQATTIGPSPVETPQPIPSTSPIVVNNCGDFSSGGNYILQQDFVAEATSGGCLTFHNTQNLSFDCQGHTITDASKTGITLYLHDLANFFVKNCTIVSSDHVPEAIDNSSLGLLINNHFNSPSDNVSHLVSTYQDNNFSLTNNTLLFTEFYEENSNNSDISYNFMTAFSEPSSGSVIGGVGGNNISITNNTLDGSWDGSPVSYNPDNLVSNIGADDGIILGGEYNDYIDHNTIKNVWDTGIETTGYIHNTQITNNTVSMANYSGIGAWWWNSWLGNVVTGNTATSSTQLFSFYLTGGLLYGEPVAYFKDNQFSGNIFKPNTSPSISLRDAGYFDFEFIPSSVTSDQVIIGNNGFKDNDFGNFTGGPSFNPASMIVDQGGNNCIPSEFSNTGGLACLGISSPPITSPVQPSLSPTSQVLGDFTGDSHVNLFDLSIFANSYGTSAPNIPNPQCDLNSDGSVNIFDLSIFARNYGV